MRKPVIIFLTVATVVAVGLTVLSAMQAAYSDGHPKKVHLFENTYSLFGVCVTSTLVVFVALILAIWKLPKNS